MGKKNEELSKNMEAKKAETMKEADELLAKNDVAALRKMLEESETDKINLMIAMEIMVGSRDTGSASNPSEILAIKEVALSALDLAKKIVDKGQK